MKNITNKYQITKTLRFGLSQKGKTKKEGFDGEIYQSHQEFNKLVSVSEARIKKSVTTEQKTELALSIDNVARCLNNISDFLINWQRVYYRTDQIALDKDYYKIMCKKIGFEGFWFETNRRTQQKIKKPQSRIISLSALDKKDGLGKERKQYILDYWKENLLSAAEKYEVVSEKLKQFQDALNINRTDNKPNEIELRKLFLSLTHIVYDILQPLCYGQICFPKIEKLDNTKEDNKKLIEFASDYQSKSDLLSEIAELKQYFEENGGNVPFCRATLNPKTLVKNPKSTDNSINEEIKDLGLKEILKTYKDVLNYNNYLESLSAKQKLQLLNDRNTSIITRSLLFKYKPISANVQFDIAKTLSPEVGKGEEDLRAFLRGIGQPKSPAKDYADLQNKSDFNIEAYPLKVAFDFAWESLARAIYHADSDLPMDACKNFLQDNFKVKNDDTNLKLYAQLQELKAVLSTLENGNPNNAAAFRLKATNLLNEIPWKTVGNYGQQNKDEISKWLNNGKNKDDYKKAKQQIGLFRGRLKNNIQGFDNITQTNKNIAMKMGRTFATMRDKITGAAELNKVSHYAMIIEDRNTDRYVLLQPFTENEQDRIYSQTDYNNGDYTTYEVNSITSGAIAKMLRKARIDELSKNDNNRNLTSQPELTEEKKEKRNIKEWKNFIENKRWDLEFQLKLNEKNFEQIKKEVDTKCYNLRTKKINKTTLEDLVNKSDCLLLPIVNQDLAKEEKTNGNQFTKDWNSIFAQNTPWRLTPEFRVSYRKPTPDYPISDKGDKRYSRFQMIGHFLCDYIPKSDKYISNREQILNYKNDELQKKAVKDFHEDLKGKTEEENQNESMNALMAKFGNVNKKQKATTVEKPKEKFYVFGIDRGQKELATLCVIDQDKKIVGDFDIYTRSFNSERKEWEHTFFEKRHILDLSNLRVETTASIDGKAEKKKVLVDLSEIKVKDKNGNYSKPDKMQIKMQQLAYIRKLQFQMQTNPEGVLAWFKENSTKDLIINNLVDKKNGEKGLISFYGSAIEKMEDTLPVDRIEEMLQKFAALKKQEKEGEDVKLSIDQLVQLEPVDNLKNGVVANMVGVIAYLLQKFNYQVYISLEDLSNPFGSQITGGIAGVPLKQGKDEGRRMDVEKYAGLGLYNFFEMQLLKKLFRIQQDSCNILHLVPAFRAQKNYDHVAVGKEKVKGQFGIVFFVDANATSKTCPVCGTTNNKPNNQKYPNAKKGLSADGKEVWLERDKSNGNDIIRCFVCNFDTTKEYTENPLKYIKSGDDNAAYLISAAGIKAYELATTLINNQ
ncbi:MAG: hypothetical protein PHR53_07395 [Bacteroidales bacterium]|nr:hypothetical protein [Bacteroidales bacterium]